MTTAQINSERIDDIPLLMRWLLDMHIDQIVDNVLGAPHGNRQGLSYGQLAVVFVAYILSQCNHFLSPVRDWVSKHQHVLTQALGCPIRDTDFTDDRLEDLLKALGDVSREVAVHARATSTGQKSAALNRAIGALNELGRYVQGEVLPPERVLLGRVVKHWQSIIAAEQGRLGEAALKEMAPTARRAAGIVERTSAAWERPARPFDNPYIAGDPVYPPLMVGRKDVFDRIGEVWTAKKNPDSIILYGHRRMGKSTILRNLDQVAPQGWPMELGGQERGDHSIHPQYPKRSPIPCPAPAAGKCRHSPAADC